MSLKNIRFVIHISHSIEVAGLNHMILQLQCTWKLELCMVSVCWGLGNFEMHYVWKLDDIIILIHTVSYIVPWYLLKHTDVIADTRNLYIFAARESRIRIDTVWNEEMVALQATALTYIYESKSFINLLYIYLCYATSFVMHWMPYYAKQLWIYNAKCVMPWKTSQLIHHVTWILYD